MGEEKERKSENVEEGKGRVLNRCERIKYELIDFGLREGLRAREEKTGAERRSCLFRDQMNPPSSGALLSASARLHY